MYAAHFAVGLALKSCEPRSPTWGVLVGAFLPDFWWIVFARRGIEPVAPEVFFDDWSHSLLMVVIWATLFGAIFWKLGRPVVSVIWISTLSHFVLDALVHPKYMALYPYSRVHVGWIASGGTFSLRNWFLELAIVLGMSAVYAVGAKRNGLATNLVLATLVFLVGLQLLGLP